MSMIVFFSMRHPKDTCKFNHFVRINLNEIWVFFVSMMKIWVCLWVWWFFWFFFDKNTFVDIL